MQKKPKREYAITPKMFSEKYKDVLQLRRAKLSYRDVAAKMTHQYGWPMSRQRVHQICKRAGIT